MESVLLSDIDKMIETSFDDATIQHKLIMKDGTVYVLECGVEIKDGKLYFEVDTYITFWLRSRKLDMSN